MSLELLFNAREFCVFIQTSRVFCFYLMEMTFVFLINGSKFFAFISFRRLLCFYLLKKVLFLFNGGDWCVFI